MEADHASQEQEPHAAAERARRHDPMTLGIGAAAIIMFVGTGSAVLPDLVRGWSGEGGHPGSLLTNALLLNIALILFGWLRYRALLLKVAEREAEVVRAGALARIDPLTGCINRRSLAERSTELHRLALENGRGLAFIAIDLDDFKQLNDRHGHIAGDALLRITADRLRDTLPSEALVARLGGDEFGILLPYDPAKRDVVEALANAVIAATAAPVETEHHPVRTTVSLGLASDEAFEGDDIAQTTAQLMHRADIAMYHAKRFGKNRIAWFEPVMEHDLRHRSALEHSVREAVRLRQFVPYYERQIDLETGELTGFEMLARWRSPEMGLVMPTVFIPVAEEIGLIGELSHALVKQALRDAREWDPSLTLAINISPLQLRDPWFAKKLLKLMTETGFPPERLEIEITESCLHEDIGAVRATVVSLRNQGVRVSLDDFGTGFSSFAQLRSLPFDRIKIDRSFTQGLAGDADEARLAGAIVSLGEGLDLPITIEGIADESILERVRALGRFKGQGYRYGEPQDAAGVRASFAAEAGIAEPDAERDAAA